MSNRPRKCPSCGAQIQQGMRFCGKCGFDTQPQRPKPQSQQRPQGQKQKRPQEKDRKQPESGPERGQPLPTISPERPEPAERPLAVDRPLAVEHPEPAEHELPPERPSPLEKRDEQEPMLPRPVRAQATKPRSLREQSPRPASTARRPSGPSPDREDRRNTIRMIAVILAIVLVVAAAIILVIRLNDQSADEAAPPQTTSEVFEPVHVISAEEATPTPEPTPTLPPEPEEEVIETAEPESTPEAEPEETTSAMSEADETVYVSGAGVNLRTGPSTTYAIAATLSRGTELHRTGTTDGWSQVEYNGGTYYISSSLITEEKPDVPVTPTPAASSYTVTEASGTMVVISAVNVRSGPGTGYSILEVAQAGTELTRTGTVGNSWTRVTVNDKEGFVYNTYIREKDAAGTGDSTAPAGDPAGTVTIVSRANIRSGPGTGYGILGIAEVGESFDYYERSGSWYRISYKDQTAYVFNTLVSAKSS